LNKVRPAVLAAEEEYNRVQEVKRELLVQQLESDHGTDDAGYVAPDAALVGLEPALLDVFKVLCLEIYFLVYF
jgi:hypothetical protein